MQIQRQSPGLTELLARLIPGLGASLGGAAGGPVGGALGGAAGSGLGALLNQPQQSDMVIGGNQGLQQDQQPQQNSAVAAGLGDLLSRLSSMQSQKEDLGVQGAPLESTQMAEQEQKDTFKSFYDLLSPDGQSQVLTLLKTIALPQAMKGR